MVETLCLARLRGNQLGVATSLLDRLPRLRQLDLLDALVRDQKRNSLAVQLFRHRLSFPSLFPRPISGLPRDSVIKRLSNGDLAGLRLIAG